ncbi:transmembrane protein 234 isoform X2 [Passer domesticus]|uniref:transmembrane protein 234 isoform X2 n=1 Tax=Passer domesticus TaxID=48849 RepID=UPI0030FE07C3
MATVGQALALALAAALWGGSGPFLRAAAAAEEPRGRGRLRQLLAELRRLCLDRRNSQPCQVSWAGLAPPCQAGPAAAPCSPAAPGARPAQPGWIPALLPHPGLHRPVPGSATLQLPGFGCDLGDWENPGRGHWGEKGCGRNAADHAGSVPVPGWGLSSSRGCSCLSPSCEGVLGWPDPWSALPECQHCRDSHFCALRGAWGLFAEQCPVQHCRGFDPPGSGPGSGAASRFPPGFLDQQLVSPHAQVLSPPCRGLGSPKGPGLSWTQPWTQQEKSGSQAGTGSASGKVFYLQK